MGYAVQVCFRGTPGVHFIFLFFITDGVDSGFACRPSVPAENLQILCYGMLPQLKNLLSE